MFGKKKTNNQPPIIFPTVYSMPAEFYGGVNPVVEFKTVKKQVATNEQGQILTAAEKKMLQHATAVGADNKWHPAKLFSNHRVVFLSVGILFILFGVAAGWYYWWQPNHPAAQRLALVPPPVIEIAPAEVTPEVIPEPPAEVVAATPTEEVAGLLKNEAPLDFPSTLLGDSADLDNDGLTDQAEELFKSDPSAPDTDGDKYIDGVEVFNLYNPNTPPAPLKLIDSGLVKEFENPVFGFKLYYPASWAVGNVDNEYRQLLFNALNGENIEVRTLDLNPGETFNDWFARFARGQKFEELREFTPVSKDSGYRRSDDLVYYFYNNSKVFVILYHAVDPNVVNYRSVISMIANSFRLTGAPAELVPQVEETTPSLTETPSTTVELPQATASSSAAVY